MVRFEFRVPELLHKDTTVFHSVKHLSDFFLLRERESNPRRSAYETELVPPPVHPAIYFKRTLLKKKPKPYILSNTQFGVLEGILLPVFRVSHKDNNNFWIVKKIFVKL